MSQRKSLSPKEAREERLRNHCRLGRTKTEACDLEGADEKTAHNAIAGTGLKWEKNTPHNPYIPPAVAKGIFLRFSYQLTRTLKALARECNDDVYELGRLTGLSRSEIFRLLRNEPHNWTFGQVARLAEASGRAPEELLQSMVAEAVMERSGTNLVHNRKS